MFGSSKHTADATAGAERQTPLESAKLSRTGEPHAPTVYEVLAAGSENSAAFKPNEQRKGAQMADKPSPDPQDNAHLYIGAGVRLKGELSGCELLRVEGTFEGTAQTRKLILCPGGLLLGTALIDDAEVEGSFDGALHVRGRLFVRNKGHIAGQFSYGQLEIERGGLIDGKVTPFEKKADKPQVGAPARPAEAAPARQTAASPAAPGAPAAAQPAGAASAQALPPQPAGPVQPGRPATPPTNGSQPLNGSGRGPAG